MLCCLLLYIGLLTHANILFYLWEVVILVLFPILPAVLISTILLIVMRFAKFVRNKDRFQFIISIILITCVLVLESRTFTGLFSIETDEQAIKQLSTFGQNAEQMGQYLLIVNPSVNMLASPFSGKAFLAFLKLVLYSGIAMVIFLAIGRITYLKDIVKNLTTYTKRKKKILRIDKVAKYQKVRKSYLLKEFKILLRQPVFFMQCVFPVIFILVTAVILMIGILPVIAQIMQEPEIQKIMQGATFDTEIMSAILIVMQILFSLSSLSLTAISREGKNATFMKQIPISLYRQFIYKNIPQICLNTLVTIVVLGLIWYLAPSMNGIYMLLLWGISMFMNLINSYLMLIADLRRPNLNWDTEYAVVKKSDNKIFQYAFLIISVLVLMYLGNLFDNSDILVALVGELIMFAVLFIGMDRCVKKWQNKLFNKIM